MTSTIPIRRISPSGKQTFFGYYDIPAANTAGLHLCHKVGFRDRLPTPRDTAELGWLSVPSGMEAPEETPTFTPFAETCAWNFQQGAMLQWVTPESDSCLYNVFEHGRFGACLQHVPSGSRRMLPLPVANVSRDGRQALCINMARLFDFRPGYGYVNTPDPFARCDAPDGDGVFLMQLGDGSSRLILSLSEIADVIERTTGETLAGHKVLINHITFNPSATRYLFLLRTFPIGASHDWKTFLLTADTEGGGLRQHPVWDYASHYHWRDDETMLFHANASAADGAQLVLISDATGERRIVDRVFFSHDGHCSYSPNKRWILYDSYPDQASPEYARSLLVYSVDREKGLLLGRFKSEAFSHATVDLRCDLHPRWMPDGQSITFDSIHEGYRAVYWADLSGALETAGDWTTGVASPLHG